MKMNNPVWYETTYDGLPPDGRRMTLRGAVWKTLLLLCCLFGAGAVALHTDIGGDKDALLVPTVAKAGMALALAVGMAKWKRSSSFLAVPFSLLLGASIGSGFVLLYGVPGTSILWVVTIISGLTILGLLVTYLRGTIHHRRNARIWRSAGMFAAVILNLAVLVMFGPDIMNELLAGRIEWQGLIFAFLYVLFQFLLLFVAGENFVYDFDFIEHGAEIGAPKYMEWYGAFSIMVTFIMVYFALFSIFMKKKEGQLRRPRRNLPSRPLPNF